MYLNHFLAVPGRGFRCWSSIFVWNMPTPFFEAFVACRFSVLKSLNFPRAPRYNNSSSFIHHHHPSLHHLHFDRSPLSFWVFLPLAN
jgi:hypothetical protein